eukprot:scaffold34521_cov22-Tisochrysis_lutea.AAC.2
MGAAVGACSEGDAHSMGAAVGACSEGDAHSMGACSQAWALQWVLAVRMMHTALSMAACSEGDRAGLVLICHTNQLGHVRGGDCRWGQQHRRICARSIAKRFVLRCPQALVSPHGSMWGAHVPESNGILTSNLALLPLLLREALGDQFLECPLY